MIEVTPTEFDAVLADVDTVSSVSYSTRVGLTLTSAHGRTLRVAPKDMHRFANRTSQTLPRVGDEFSPLVRHVCHDGSMVPMTSDGRRARFCFGLQAARWQGPWIDCNMSALPPWDAELLIQHMDRAEFLPTGGMKSSDLYPTRYLSDCAEA